MKHISIGEIKKLGNDLFKVSLFDGMIKKETSKDGMLSLLQKHAKGFLATKEVSSFCVDYYSSNFSKHYIIIDAAISEIELDSLDEPIVYEETEHEYRTTHKLFFKSDSTRNLINERNYTFYDVIKSSASWKKWVSKFIIFMTLIVFVFSLFVCFFSFSLGSKESEVKNYFDKRGIAAILFFFIASLSASFSTLFTWIHLKRLVVKNNSQRYFMKWRRWYKSRLLSLFISLVFAIVATTFTLWYYLLLKSDDYLVEKNLELYKNTKNISLITFFILILFVFMLIWILVTIDFRKRKFLKTLFKKEEKKQFRKWLFYKSPNIQRNQDNKFLFDPISSEVVVAKEIENSVQLEKELGKEGMKRYKRKVTNHFDNGNSVYISILKNK